MKTRALITAAAAALLLSACGGDYPAEDETGYDPMPTQESTPTVSVPDAEVIADTGITTFCHKGNRIYDGYKTMVVVPQDPSCGGKATP